MEKIVISILYLCMATLVYADDKQDYLRAIESYEKQYQTTPTATLAYNIGLLYISKIVNQENKGVTWFVKADKAGHPKAKTFIDYYLVPANELNDQSLDRVVESYSAVNQSSNTSQTVSKTTKQSPITASTYRVRSGDSLSAITQRFLVGMNQLVNGDNTKKAMNVIFNSNPHAFENNSMHKLKKDVTLLLSANQGSQKVQVVDNVSAPQTNIETEEIVSAPPAPIQSEPTPGPVIPSEQDIQERVDAKVKKLVDAYKVEQTKLLAQKDTSIKLLETTVSKNQKIIEENKTTLANAKALKDQLEVKVSTLTTSNDVLTKANTGLKTTIAMKLSENALLFEKDKKQTAKIQSLSEKLKSEQERNVNLAQTKEDLAATVTFYNEKIAQLNTLMSQITITIN